MRNFIKLVKIALLLTLISATLERLLKLTRKLTNSIIHG